MRLSPGAVARLRIVDKKTIFATGNLGKNKSGFYLEGRAGAGFMVAKRKASPKEPGRAPEQGKKKPAQAI